MNSRIKITVLGGSALATPKLFEALGRAGARASYDAVLVGRDAERLELVTHLSRHLLQPFAEADIRISTSQDAGQALEGADYVVNQVRVGGLEGRAFDESFPRQLGIPGEETVGPGGFSSALRGIPVVLEQCHLIEQAAPGAVMLNLTNPSSIIQYAVRRYTAVPVVGTCDSPVVLMQSVAALLGAPLADLDIDMGGMHHCGWITAVRHAGVDRLPEVLARAGELPKLGVDPDLPRAFGALPNGYMRYYLHPERMLAAADGRKQRAHELMEMSERVLEGLRAWQPGQPTAMLEERNAVWYELSVAPTLLALAEQRDGTLILSVDNLSTLPWLPPNAIIEGPVPIRDGQLMPPRPAALPVDVQALLHRNCAYEMLAAEAIMERDRAKALRALTANLMVRSTDQARQVLDLLWPQ